jgi:hypothetical protein
MEVKQELIAPEGKKYVCKHSYSFIAKLIKSNDEIKNQYMELANAFASVGLKLSPSFNQVRVYVGRKTYALVVFRGKKLAVALALDPKKYEETKYRGIDASNKKKYANTPMILKLTSPRKQKYLLQLINDMASEASLTNKEVTLELDLADKDLATLIQEGLVKEKMVLVDDDFVELNEEEELFETEDEEDFDDIIEDEDDEEECSQMTMPKLGNRKSVVNLSHINEAFDDGSSPCIFCFMRKGLVAQGTGRIKVLATGNITKKIHLKGFKCSKAAKTKILAAGGSVE